MPVDEGAASGSFARRPSATFGETTRRIEKARLATRLQVASVTLWEIALLVQEHKLRLTKPASGTLGLDVVEI